MSTIIGAQSAFAAWQQAMAEATGGRVFTTHGCEWAWLPARRRLVLLFPGKAVSAGLRPGLAEGNRLGATEVSVWLNAAVPDGALREFGFRDAAPVLWHAGELSGPSGHWEGDIRLDADVPEAKGADATELHVATQWKSTIRPRTLGAGGDGVATVRVGAGHPSQRRVEHATAREADGTLVGRGFAQYTGAGRLAVHGMAVAPTHRGQGVGRSILHALAGAASFPAHTGAADAGSAGAGRSATHMPQTDTVWGTPPQRNAARGNTGQDRPARDGSTGGNMDAAGPVPAPGARPGQTSPGTGRPTPLPTGLRDTYGAPLAMAPGAFAGVSASGNDGGAATLPAAGTDVVAGCRPGSSGFFTACGLQLIGRGRHLVLRGS